MMIKMWLCHSETLLPHCLAQWRERIKVWFRERTRPNREITRDKTWPSTDDEVINQWKPVTEIRPGCWSFNPLLDLPLKPYAGMNKTVMWEMFIYRLAESEAQNILEAEKSWMKARADIMPEGPLVSGKRSQEAPLRPSDLAAAVIVWLWRNGLRYEAISVFVQIWRMARGRQEQNPQPSIPWPADSALDGFRIAAHRDWGDDDQAEFVAMFREHFVLQEVERGIENLISQ